MKYVIIGNSAAAVGAVESIRQVDQAGEIVLISREPYHTYSRPLIAYWLKGKTDADHMGYRPEDFYAKNACTTLFSKLAVSIDPAAHQVALEDGSAVSYDKLLVATGSKPNIQDTEGLEQVACRHTFLDWGDAQQIAADITPSSRVLIWGAGLIGLKCAEAVYGQVKEVTVLNRSNMVLRSILDEEAAAIVTQHLTEQGLRLQLGKTVQRFAAHTTYLSDGGTIDFDVLILAAGVQPNAGLVAAAGGQVETGIVINSRMETSLPDIYAAGDCTENYDLSSHTRRVLATLPNAYQQGEYAGLNMAGAGREFPGALPVNSVSFFGLQVVTAGSRGGETYTEHAEKDFKRLFYQEDRLKGYILIGNIARAGIYTQLIREQVPLSTLDFPLICKHPGLMAFSKAERGKKLGGRLPA
jgi:NAD(P)H-nitrite reductase large subunit